MEIISSEDLKEAKDAKDAKETKNVEIKVMPKIKDRFWKQKLAKIMANLFGSKVLYKIDRPSRRIARNYAKYEANNCEKLICVFLDLANTTSFSEISSCLEEIQKNISKEGFSKLKIQFFYWDQGVKVISLSSTQRMKEKIELIYLKARESYLKAMESHLDDFILESKQIADNMDLFITITDKNDSCDIISSVENLLFYKRLKNKFIFCFVNQGLAGNNLEIDRKIEKNTIIVYE